MRKKRTQEEIMNRINEVENHDIMGFERIDLIYSLNFKNAKKYFKEDITKEEFYKGRNKTIRQTIIEYIPFAFDKANNFRGLSAMRSMCHMRAWLWLDCKDEFLKENDLLKYEYYAKDHLVNICKLYKIDHTKYDDGVRQN